MPAGRRSLAREGEQLAAEHLTRAGYRIAARNVRAGGVEIDLSRVRALTVFVEAKARSGRGFGSPRRPSMRASALASYAAPAPGSTPTARDTHGPAST
jgi:putative endonuclease